jgi:hypothetical protein
MATQEQHISEEQAIASELKMYAGLIGIIAPIFAAMILENLEIGVITSVPLALYILHHSRLSMSYYMRENGDQAKKSK